MNYKGILYILGGILVFLIVIKLLFRRKTTEDKEREKLEKQQDVESEKRGLIKEKQKTFVKEYDNSKDNPLSDNYVNRGKAILTKENRDIAFAISKELLKIDSDEEKIITLFGKFPNRDTIHTYRITMLQVNDKYNWNKLIAKAFKGLTDPFTDLFNLYDVISKKP